MKYDKSIIKDAYLYYGGFDKATAIKKYGIVPDLSLLSISSCFMEKNDFIQECSKDIKAFFEKESLRAYKFYLVANVEMTNPNSRIEKYKKVWKTLEGEKGVESIVKGYEVEFTYGEKTFFSSIGEFKIENISEAIRILSMKYFKFTIIATKNDLLSEDMIRDVFDSAFKESDLKYPCINYLNLCVKLCSRQDIVFRWGDSGEELSIDLIFLASLNSQP